MEITKDMYLLAKKIVKAWENRKVDVESPKRKEKHINERKIEFMQEVAKFMNIYEGEMLRDFCDYWCEHGLKDKKFRAEKQTSFNIERRLRTWYKNQIKFKNGKQVSAGFKQSIIEGLQS